jgi:hypothetical protein
MTQHTPDPNAPRPSTLQSMVARLRGMFHALKNPEAEPGATPATTAPPADEELLPTFDTPLATPVAPPAGEPASATPPVAVPVTEPKAGSVP